MKRLRTVVIYRFICIHKVVFLQYSYQNTGSKVRSLLLGTAKFRHHKVSFLLSVGAVSCQHSALVPLTCVSEFIMTFHKSHKCDSVADIQK